MEALAYILDRYPASVEGLAELLESVPGMMSSSQPFETEAVAPDGTRPDMLQRGEDGSERLFIEAKFYAPLTRNQPVSYLNRLPENGVSVLMFLAPAERVEELWPELLGKLAGAGVQIRPRVPVTLPLRERVSISSSRTGQNCWTA